MQNNPVLVKNALDSIGIDTLNPMQLAALSANEMDKDMILLSPTGSGKTVAFLLPVLLGLNPDCKNVQALILAPSRELAQQIESVWRSLGTGYKVNSCFGGRPSNGEKRDLAVPPAVLIGTPGRIQDHIERANFDAIDIRILVLDEFDKSLEMGFLEQMESIVTRIPNLNKRILTSATDSIAIPEFVGIKNPMKLDFSDKENKLEGLKEYSVRGKTNDKFDLLYQLICYLGNDSVLVFCNQRDIVEKVNAYLTQRKIANEFFHGKLEQPDRERALSKFRNGSCTVFVSTDLASRGLDIPEVRHVVHFDMPVRIDELVHRNGRTARMNASGNAYLVLSVNELLPAFILTAPHELTLPVLSSMPPKPEWATLYIGKGKKDKISKMDIVGFLFKKGQLSKEELGLVEVKDFYSFVAIKSNRISAVLKLIENERIKNLKTKFELAL